MASCSPHHVPFILLLHQAQCLPWGPPEARALARLDSQSAPVPLFLLKSFGRPQTHPCAGRQKGLQNLRKFYLTAKPFLRNLYLCHLFTFQACFSSLIFFFFSHPNTSSSSILSLVNNAYHFHCYADRQRQVVYQRIKLYRELQCNSCNLVPCG